MADSASLLKAYLSRLLEIRGSGAAVPETSYYGAVEALLNGVGDTLKPRVVCNPQLANQGAGHPDYGLFTRSQLRGGEVRPGQAPERGVVEMKSLDEPTEVTAVSLQSNKYLDQYGLLLLTNIREFRLVKRTLTGDVELERYTLAADANSLWSLTLKPSLAAKRHAFHLTEMLRRALSANAPLTRAEDVAWFLASYARDALADVEAASASGLKPLRDALQASLGIAFTGEKGEHLFRSSLVQTLFYGVFSAWVTHARKTATTFDWRLAAHELTVPMVRSLFEEIAKPSRLSQLGLAEHLDRANLALNRIEVKAFLSGFDAGEAIQHFYEPFLAAFDAELRKQLGVWYTPKEVVQYMVERVDRLLRTELGLAEGLADPSVYVVDPCCGTGAYVVAVLERIACTLKENGADAAELEALKDAALRRVVGFELMPAPFVIAHWRVGGFLADEKIKQPLSLAKGERAAIYLTNALTGWEPVSREKAAAFPEFEAEADAADEVKQERKILVILGNPPYNAYAGVSPPDEEGLVRPYKEGLAKRWGVKKFNLDDPYVRFFRVAERRIAKTGRGIVSFISNASYVDDDSFVVMREKLLEEFDAIWVDNLNGDSRETGKRTPEGDPDPSVFSTDYNREGIKVGTAVSTLVRSGASKTSAHVYFRQFWGVTKRADLLASLDDDGPPFETVSPEPRARLSFKPHSASADYRAWPDLPSLAAVAPINGLMEKRGGALIDADKGALRARMEAYLDPEVEFAELEQEAHRLTRRAARFDPKLARKKLLHEGWSEDRLTPYLVRAFELAWAYRTTTRPIWNEPRPLLQTAFAVPQNAFLLSRPARVSEPEGVPLLFSRTLFDNDAQRGHAYGFPYSAVDDHGVLLGSTVIPNVSQQAAKWLTDMCGPDQPPHRLWRHVLAVGYTPAYLSENASALAKGWPRIPLPAHAGELAASEALGEKLENLLDPLKAVTGVTTGGLSPIHKIVGALSASNYRVSAGWGYRDQQGRVNAGRGKIATREWSKAELEAIRDEAATREMALDVILAQIGAATDVYLNNVACWQGIPEAVWNYHIGGYQVLKKWLSYREFGVLGREITPQEARDFRDSVRRLTEILLLGAKLNDSYAAITGAVYPWKAAN